ncbi:MAG: hypothetical protein ACYCPT_04250 [Acidimicrobiales bacterium]
MNARIQPEPRWPASLALVVCAGLYVLLPSRLAVGPKWLLPVLIVLPLIPLSARKNRHPDDGSWVRYLAVGLVAVITVANCASVVLLIHHVFFAHQVQGRQLLYSAASIWVTNFIVFGLWLWELDRGGPHVRAGGEARWPDIQFPQMDKPDLAAPSWRPRFGDYLYTSFANGTSFAPADAMPLTGQAKALFALEALISFVTIAVVAGEAVNILR